RARIARQVLDQREAAARRERLAGTGDDHDASLRIGVDGGPDLGELPVQARVGRVQHLGPVDGDEEHPVRLGLEREVPEVGVVHDDAPQASSGPTPPPVHENECAVSSAGNGAAGASTAVRTYASTVSNSSSVLMRRNHSGRPLRYAKTTLASLHGPRHSENAKRTFPWSPAASNTRRVAGRAMRVAPLLVCPQQHPKQANISPASATDCHGTRAAGPPEQEA